MFLIDVCFIRLEGLLGVCLPCWGKLVGDGQVIKVWVVVCGEDCRCIKGGGAAISDGFGLMIG